MYNLKTSERAIYGENYLVISLEGKSLITYQEDMLYENRLPGYLGFYSKFENETLIFYNITNCVRLSDFIGNRKLNRTQYLMIVDAIIDAMILRDQYFLSVDSLLIHQDYIFIKDSSEITMIYLPTHVNVDSKKALKDFVMWLTTRLDTSEPGAADASIPLQYILNSPTYSLKVVKETIAQILHGAPNVPIPKAKRPASNASSPKGKRASPNPSNSKAKNVVPSEQPMDSELYYHGEQEHVSIPDVQSGNPASGRPRNKGKEKDENLFGIGVKKKKVDKKPEKTRGKPTRKKSARDGYSDESTMAQTGHYGTQPNQYIDPREHYYENTGDYPAASTDYPTRTTDYPLHSTDYPPGSTDYPVRSSDYPARSTDYPTNSSEYSARTTDYPMDSTEYSTSSRDYPSSRPDYPNGTTDYPTSSKEYSGSRPDYPNGTTDYPTSSREYSGSRPDYPSSAAEYPKGATDYPPEAPDYATPSSGYPSNYTSGISEEIQYLVYLLYKPNTADEQIIHVNKSPFIVGRGENSDYVINDRSISREHAQIIMEANKVYLVDSKSKFGTYVNDKRLPPDVIKELIDDDSIMFSGFIFNVKIVPMDTLYSLPG